MALPSVPAPPRSTNKIGPPPLAAITRVPRISERIDAALGRPVVWVQGPPGAGKTSSVALYLAGAGLEAIWLRLDADDSDAATFFISLQDAHARKHAAGSLPAARPEYLREPKAFARRFFSAFFARPEPTILVLDDYSEVDADSIVHGLVAEGLDRLPPGHRVIVVSRHPPPPAFARLRLHGVIDLLPADLLGLTIDEAAELALHRRIAFDRDDVAAIVAKTHGWVTGLILMLEVSGESILRAAAGIDLPEVLFDYFAGEIFEHLAPRDRRNLTILALVPGLPLSMVAPLTEDGSAVDLIEHFARRSYFTFRGDETDPHIRFHALFREFLLRQGRASLSGGELRRLQLRAAGLLERCDQIQAAAALYVDLGEWHGLAGLIRTAAPALARQGRFAVLAAWLEALPEETVQADGWLCLWKATALAATAPAQSRPVYRHALALMRCGHDVTGTLLGWAGLANSIIDDAASDQAELDGDISLFFEIVDQVRSFPGAEVEYRVALTIFLALNRRSPDRAAMALWRDRALAAAAKLGAPGIIISMRCYIALYALIDGDFATMREQFDVIPPAAALGREPLLQAIIFVAQGLGQMYAQIPGRCEKTAEEALAASRESGIYLWTHVHAACEAVAESDLERGRIWLRRTAQLTGKVSIYHGAHYQMVSTLIALLAGDGENAVRSGRLAVDMTVADGWFLYEMIARVGLAQAYEATGQIASAFAELDAAEAAARRVAAGSLDVSFLFLRADLLLQHDGADEGLQALRTAFAWADKTGARRTLLTPFRNARLCARALQEGLHVERAKDFITASRLPPPDPTVEAWPWALAIRTLGAFAILKDGVPLALSRKTPRRLFTLLKAIVAFGGVDVPQTMLVDAVWPDEEGDAGHRALETAVYRLRKLLGDLEVLVLKAGRISLNGERCWVDVWAFEEGLARPRDDASRVRALTLYKGDFLHGDDEPWVVARRRRLQARYAKAVPAASS